jgi:hypothetical protein
VTTTTSLLAQRAVAARERTFGHTIEGYVTWPRHRRIVLLRRCASRRRCRLINEARLQTSLSRQIGRDVTIQEVIDPGVWAEFASSSAARCSKAPWRAGWRRLDASSNSWWTRSQLKIRTSR